MGTDNRLGFYRAFDVWRKLDGRCLVRYRCFEFLASGKYSVQSADFYRFPLEPDQCAFLDKQFLELFVEQSPLDRGGGYDTIEEAIRAHDKDFENG